MITRKRTLYGLFAGLILLTLLSKAPAARGEEALEIGSRLELFVDQCLIAQLKGGAALHLHKPVPREVVFVADKPWEGNTCAYFSLFQDGNLYRMYYRGSHADTKTRKPLHRQVTCYAESKDGIHWTRPALGLCEFDGSKQNNIIWDGIGSHNFTPFLDTNPACPAEAKYKALGSDRAGNGKQALFAFQSPDGVHWKPLSDKPVITQGAFDSQNLAFWDPVRKCYVDYHRTFRDRVRDIMTCTSQDFLHWTEPALLEYPGAPQEHLYTNAIRPYLRAPHILIGFPARFQPKRGEQVEPLLMTSRDGLSFHRWPDPVIPVTAPTDRTGNRSNYMAWGMLSLPAAEKELTVYGTEAYYAGPAGRLRRFTYRTDGFVSVRAPAAGGEVLTKPLRFVGDRLVLNCATAPRGGLRVEIQDEAGKPLKGFRLEDCPAIHDDSIAHVVCWSGGSDVGRLAGKPVRLRFVLQDGDLFSFRVAAR